MIRHWRFTDGVLIGDELLKEWALIEVVGTNGLLGADVYLSGKLAAVVARLQWS